MRLLIALLPWLELFTLIQLGIETSALTAIGYVLLTLLLGIVILQWQGRDCGPATAIWAPCYRKSNCLSLFVSPVASQQDSTESIEHAFSDWDSLIKRVSNTPPPGRSCPYGKR